MREKVLTLTKKDFEISWYSGTGGGGQHRNKHQNCCRITHKETGIKAISQDYREREQNKKQAFLRLINNPKFNKWFKIQVARALMGKDEWDKEIKRKVDESMKPENIKIEYGVSNVD